MPRTLWAKFLLLLLAVSAVALSATFVLRTLMVRDFRTYLEGQAEDRVYWITADAERTYEKHGGWSEEWLEEDALWALMLGFQIRVRDADGRVVSDTESSVASLSPLMKGRGVATFEPGPARADYVPYPLFLAGTQIGTLEVRPLGPGKETVFVERSNRFLLLSMIALGGVALILSAFASRRLTRRLAHLASAARAVSRGDLDSRVPAGGRDEIASLGETFNQMATSLKRLDELRTRLLTDLAHDLRTPLGAMRGELEGMIDGLIPTTRQAIESLHEEAGRLKRMLDGIEDLARAQASVLTLAKERQPLRPLLEHVLERVERGTRGKAVSLRLECSEALAVDADPDKLSQIVLNVLDNAVKAVKDGGSVTARALTRGGQVEISIEDDGVGIAAGDLPFVFERFWRRSEGGLGIGLAITRELMEAHGGRIDVRSEEGKGTTFTLRFPA